MIHYLSKAILLQCCLLISFSAQLTKVDLHMFEDRLVALIHVSKQLILHENGFKMKQLKSSDFRWISLSYVFENVYFRHGSF